MAFTVGDRGIVQGRAVLPWNGCWVFEGRLTGEGDPPAIGERVQITLGTLVLSGTVHRSGTFGGRPAIRVLGGADGWRKRLRRRSPYRDRAGVKLAAVALDIARDAGETAVLAPELRDVVVGYAWSRNTVRAGTALSLIRLNGEPLPWHVRPDGSTWIGARPLRAAPAGVEAVAEEIWPADGSAVLGVKGDDFAALLPGTLLGLPGIPADAPVRELAINVSSSGAKAELLFFDTMPEMLADLVENARELSIFLGAHVYQVVQQFGDQVTVRPLSSVEGLTEELILDKAHGLPGASATLQKGALVLVTWRGGDPGWPLVVGYFGTRKPRDVTVDAEQLLRIGPNVPDLDELDGGHGVHIGGGARPVAMGDALETWAAAAHNLLQAVGVAVLGPSAPTVLAEDAAYDLATSSALGLSSRKLGTR